MKKVQHSITYTVFDTLEEVPELERGLLEKAIESKENAYAPYSNFSVGAAILLDNGTVVVGNNQENAAYPSGLCAERVAIFHASANFPKSKFLKIAIAASSSLKKVHRPVGPCGSCRQAIAEYEHKQDTPIEIIFMGETGGIIKTDSLSDLLPLGFNNSFL